MTTEIVLLCAGQKPFVIEGEFKLIESFKEKLADKGKEMDLRQSVRTLYMMNDEQAYNDARTFWENMKK